MTPQKHSSRALYVRLLRHVWPYRHALLGAVVAMVVGGLADASLVKVGEYVVEELFVRHDRTYAAILPLAIVGVFLVSGVASFASGYGMQWIGNKVVLDLRREMFAKVLKLPPGFFDEVPTARWFSRLIWRSRRLKMRTAIVMGGITRNVMRVSFQL